MTPSNLRKFARFLYEHIHRYDYGYDVGNGRKRIPKASIQQARIRKSYRGLKQLTETLIKTHLTQKVTYYYVGSHKSRRLLLCVDIDAHEGQSDSLDVANYLNFWWLEGNGYIEPSTNGLGIHLYFLVSYPEYTATETLKVLFNNLAGLMARQVEWEGYESKVCMIGGLPSDWTNDTMAELIKLPRPNDNTLPLLLNAKVMSLADMKGYVERNLKEHDAFAAAPTATVSALVSPSSSSCLMTVTPQGVSITNNNTQPPYIDNDKLHIDVSTIGSHKPFDKALWTVRTLSHVLGRMPNLFEALDLYDRLQIGTGASTEKRVIRFEQAIAYTTQTFDPSKRKSFKGLYPHLKIIIQRAVHNHPSVSLTYSPKRQITIENLCVGYYFATWKCSTNNYTLPIDGIIALNVKLLEANEVTGTIGYQKASAIRRILCELELLELTDADYDFGWKGKAMKYRLAFQTLPTPGAAPTP